MANNLPTRKDADALKTALMLEQAAPRPEESNRALAALSPHIGRAAHRLSELAAERRAVRRQAWALAGCSFLFAVLAGLAYQYRAFLLARPERWGPIAAFGALALLLVCCLPIILKSERMIRDEK